MVGLSPTELMPCPAHFQSMMAGLANALEESGQSSGSAGLIVSICMLCGGIVSIVSRKNNSKGTNIALIILFGLATFTGFVLAGNYSDLYGLLGV